MNNIHVHSNDTMIKTTNDEVTFKFSNNDDDDENDYYLL